MIDFIQQFFLDPLQFEFMQRALLAALLVGMISGVMGAYVVTRGMSFLGDALAHSILPGVAVAFISGGGQGQLLFGGLVAGALSALTIGFFTRRRRLTEDVAIGIVFSGTFALGVAIISTQRSYTTDLTHILVGNILAVNDESLRMMAVSGGIVLLAVLALYKEFLVISFDSILAETLRLPSEALRLTLLVLLAVTIVIGIQSVGVALVAAMLVTPAASARFFVRRLHHLMILSAVTAAFSGIGGMYAAWHLQIAPSAAIVLIMTLIFLLTFFFAPQKGYLWSLLRRSSQRA